MRIYWIEANMCSEGVWDITLNGMTVGNRQRM